MAQPDPSYKVIALISGGKDSFLSILECQRQGHEMVAFANLYPPLTASNDEDLNSHMYQTAGHTVIPLYETATGLPLFRSEIQGRAIQVGREYDSSSLSHMSNDHDEIEDLTELLQRVIHAHPEANAVCSGAVLSTYQRTRVEDVCLRLGLKSLAYLWQMSLLSLPENASITERSGALLDRFATEGLDARIVKVASGGLDESFLWQSLLDSKTRHRIKAAMKKFGGSIIGEGGEFETLVLDGPQSLFRNKVLISEDLICIRHGQGGEAWIDVDLDRLNQPAVEQALASRLSDSVELQFHIAQTNSTQNLENERHQDISNKDLQIYGHRASGGFVWYDNMKASDPQDNSCQNQAELICRCLRMSLQAQDLTTVNLVFTTIVLRSVEDFDTVNKIYGRLFTSPIPAARVTIASDKLEEGISVMMSFVAWKGNLREKQGLHVQSISHWAPANIGPYSQAVSVPVSIDASRLVFVAGQIALNPSTMQPAQYADDTTHMAFKKRAHLALRHANRIGVEQTVCWWSHAVAFVTGDSQMDAIERATIALQVWEEMHQRNGDLLSDEEDNKGPDVWDLKYGGQGSFATNEENQGRSLPCFDSVRSGSTYLPGFVAVEVSELPRQQHIEWQVIGYAGGQIAIQGEDRCCQLYGSGQQHAIMKTTVSLVNTTEQKNALVEDFVSRTLYTTKPLSQTFAGVQIPCRRVWIASTNSLGLQSVAEAIVTQDFIQCT